MSAETVEVPFKMSGNRRCLTDEQLSESPHLADFVRQFKDSFERDDRMSLWLFKEPRP